MVRNGNCIQQKQLQRTKNRKAGLQLSKAIKYDEQIEDLFDVIIAESRAEEPTVAWEEVKMQLKKKGKL